MEFAADLRGHVQPLHSRRLIRLTRLELSDQEVPRMNDIADPPDDGGNNEKPNPFDPQRLRLTQRHGESQDVRRILVSVPVRKPGRQEFFRTQPDLTMWLEAAILELKEDRLSYLVEPTLAPYLPGEAVAKILVPTITTHGAIFVWPIKLEDERGRLDEWNAVALEAAERAREKWIRLVANIGAGTYDVLEAAGVFPEPAWPELSLQRILSLAFKDRVIDSIDHPVLRRLRGEI